MKTALKKIIVFFLVIVTLAISRESFDAYETNLSLGVSASSIKIGDTVTLTVKVPGAVSGPIKLTYPSQIFDYVSASSEVNPANGTVLISIGTGGRAQSNTVTVKLKAKTTTDSTPAVVEAAPYGDIFDNDSLESVLLKEASVTINVANQTTDSGNGGGGTTEPQKSSDNTLSSLKLSSGTLSPSFKKNTTNYTATVGYDVSKVVVTAKANHSKAVVESVTGNGTVNLNVGDNTIKVVVRAENGVKKTYTIVVTRKAQETTTPPTSESESEQPVVNEMLQWNGEQLQAVEEIPTDKIPASFESTLLVVNGQQMQGLSFEKGDLKVLYLNNTNNAGSLYVYDEVQQTIYPFIKLTSEKSYVMVLLPDEQNAPAPEGFESCTFSIEGKGIVSAYQLKENAPIGNEELEDSTMTWNPFAPETFYAAEPKASDFYLIYCMNDDGEKSWYMYDFVEETFQRYLATAPSVQVDDENSDMESKYAALQKELNTAKMTQYIIVAIAAAVIFILIVVVIVLAVRNRNKNEDFFEGYEDEDEYEEDEYEEETEAEECVEEVEVIEEVETTEEVVDDDDEIEIEFYEMESAPVVETAEEVYVDTIVEPEVEEQKPVVKAEPVSKKEETEEIEEIKIERRPRVADPTSILTSTKEDDDDLEFIDFE